MGPFHVNIYWTKRAIEKKEVGISDIYRASGVNGGGNVFGTMLFDPLTTATKDKTKWRPARFDGDPLANGRLAARRIKANAGSTEGEKVSRYAPDPADRLKKYNDWAPKWRGFFACYGG